MQYIAYPKYFADIGCSQYEPTRRVRFLTQDHSAELLKELPPHLAAEHLVYAGNVGIHGTITAQSIEYPLVGSGERS